MSGHDLTYPASGNSDLFLGWRQLFLTIENKCVLELVRASGDARGDKLSSNAAIPTRIIA